MLVKINNQSQLILNESNKVDVSHGNAVGKFYKLRRIWLSGFETIENGINFQWNVKSIYMFISSYPIPSRCHRFKNRWRSFYAKFMWIWFCLGVCVCVCACAKPKSVITQCVRMSELESIKTVMSTQCLLMRMGQKRLRI